MEIQNSSSNRLVEANIHLQDMNRALDTENRQIKSLLLRCYELLKHHDENEQIYYLLEDIKEMLRL